MIFLTLMIWITCVILCGILASNRNRSVFLWSFAGLLFGPFAVVIVLALKPLSR